MPDHSLTRRHFLAASAATTVYLTTSQAGHADEMTFDFITPFSFSLAFGAVLYADAAGYYAAEGLTFRPQSGKGAALAAQMVIAEQMDAGRTGGTNFILSRVENDAPLISIATIAQLSPFFVITSGEDPADTVEDLQGRTVGMASLGGSMEGTLDLLMRKGGFDPDSVKKVKVADTAASYALIEAGRAGAFIGNTSSMIKAQSESEGVHAFAMDDGMPGQVYVAHPDVIAANPEKFIAFLKATHKAAAEIAALPQDQLDPILQAIGGKFDVSGLDDVETARSDLYTNAQNWVAKGDENLLRNVPEVWASAVEMLFEAGMITKQVDPTTLYTNDLLESALA
ncbi:myristoyl transferase [Pseudooceanicola sediminis]|uniref:Myristoyl transferase n=1 Tax=Pseudooceanicola sediminis TaxID=2211117 RepID=A0A399J0E6_9RHOB|nr:ABC transporter substrate-binding protein [Pseudooceanicola sediminis]KAA2315078.1 ABC transporter substrate-binding protein [Puniceibacterium sp. HSS470]RII38893.1 myristoyl transferase [Pseudooceanicola sediminis]|tara:strand:+ start:23041 stop:24060 length:1020 start_codon:yes stop_codon:yes gene_type:complete